MRGILSSVFLLDQFAPPFRGHPTCHAAGEGLVVLAHRRGEKTGRGSRTSRGSPRENGKTDNEKHKTCGLKGLKVCPCAVVELSFFVFFFSGASVRSKGTCIPPKPLNDLNKISNLIVLQ